METKTVYSPGTEECKEEVPQILPSSQVPQEMMDEAIDIALRQCEGVVAHALLAHRAIDEVLGRLLDEIEDNGSFAETDVFIPDCRRPPAPAIPAAVRAADHTRITAIGNRNREVAARHGKVVIHQEIGRRGIADLIEALGGQRLLNGRLYTLANLFVIGVVVALDGFTTRNRIARNDGA